MRTPSHISARSMARRRWNQSIPPTDPKAFTRRWTEDPAHATDSESGTVKALWQVQQCVIENNIIELVPSFMDWGPPVGVQFIVHPGGIAADMTGFRIFRRVVIRNNVIRYVDNLKEQTVRNVGIHLDYCEDALVENNAVDLAISDPIRHDIHNTNVKYFNNRNSAGLLIPGALYPSGGPAVKRDELTTLVADATGMSLL